MVAGGQVGKGNLTPRGGRPNASKHGFPGCAGIADVVRAAQTHPSLREVLRRRGYEVLGCPVWAWTGHPA